MSSFIFALVVTVLLKHNVAYGGNGNSCDASAAPSNGGLGNCPSTLDSGYTCQPTCNPGFTVSGTSSCFTGTLTAATCNGMLHDSRTIQNA